MSQLLINKYLNELDRYKKISGSSTEGVISEAFKDLLKDWSRQQNLTFISQFEFASPNGNRIRPDGTIRYDLRVPFGYWEAKDTNDDLNVEIAKKQAKGYPQDNIIYEDSHTAVLIQNKNEVMRCEMLDTAKLFKLVTLFFKYERQEIADFRKAVAQFKIDLPAVLEALREKINDAYTSNVAFKEAAAKFLAHAKNTINPVVSEADVREMLIQHILTEEIFNKVFNSEFHRENNIAKELYSLEDKFFIGAVKQNTLRGLEPYYAAIRSNAALITSHSEKQTFLKVIYENFYKVYNPKAADRLGVVYTPNEIVKFMIEGADWLTQKHFGKSLIDKDVEILDPATGTGTFICELLEHFRGQPQKLAHKYKEELHANEVAILPYYVANLNIEATYAAISGQFAEFPNLCFVDTLDNVGGLGIRAGTQLDMLAGLSDENIERVKRQNKRKISVIIGNPPYNANQANENDNNKNREYAHIDKAIKATYIKQSTAQKTKLYDMYARFFRWASDRMNDDGVLAFITNRSFIESRTFDGFRKTVAEEFNEIYVMDLGGDWKLQGSAGGGNVFGIGTGVAISFWVKQSKSSRKSNTSAQIKYATTGAIFAEDKLTYLAHNSLQNVVFEIVSPDSDGYWHNKPESTYSKELPLVSKSTKLAKSGQEKAIFKLFSLGVATNRDEWVYDFSAKNLSSKVSHFATVYEAECLRWKKSGKIGSSSEWVSREIKWTSELEDHLRKGHKLPFVENRIREAIYRPFVKMKTYYDRGFTHRLYQQNLIFPIDKRDDNFALLFTDPSAQKPWLACVADCLPDLHFVGAAAGTVCAPRHCYSENGERIDNITDWGLKQFQTHYKTNPSRPAKGRAPQGEGITKDHIFNYVYGVLHDPIYREKYAINLKREFPRIPFYLDFQQWAAWGAKLMAIHIGYEQVKPWDLQRVDVATSATPIPKLKADKGNGTIMLDSATQLSGIPASAWDYRLGNRSGLEWILDQYKEKKPKDPTIREKFNTYRFADYKEKVIDLLARVTRVSVETMEIVEAMKTVKRD